MRTLITGGTIVNEGRTFPGSVLIEDGNIVEILETPSSFLCLDSCVPSVASDQSSDVSFQQIDATGAGDCYDGAFLPVSCQGSRWIRLLRWHLQPAP
jgi:hypothetical protein